MGKELWVIMVEEQGSAEEHRAETCRKLWNFDSVEDLNNFKADLFILPLFHSTLIFYFTLLAVIFYIKLFYLYILCYIHHGK